MDRKEALEICIKSEGNCSTTVEKLEKLSDDQIIARATQTKASWTMDKPIYEVFLELENKDFGFGV